MYMINFKSERIENAKLIYSNELLFAPVYDDESIIPIVTDDRNENRNTMYLTKVAAGIYVRELIEFQLFSLV